MRLIDADALKHKYEYMNGDDDTLCECIAVLGDAPTINAAEIVRCRECKHGKPDAIYEEHTACMYRLVVMADDDFCKYGERKENT